MKQASVLACMAAAVAAALGAQAQTSAPIKADEVPQRKKVAPLPPRGTYVPVKTSWGDPASEYFAAPLLTGGIGCLCESE